MATPSISTLAPNRERDVKSATIGQGGEGNTRASLKRARILVTSNDAPVPVLPIRNSGVQRVQNSGFVHGFQSTRDTKYVELYTSVRSIHFLLTTSFLPNGSTSQGFLRTLTEPLFKLLQHKSTPIKAFLQCLFPQNPSSQSSL